MKNKIILSLFLIFNFVNILPAQNIYKNYYDGELFVKLKNDFPIEGVVKSDSVNIDDLQFIKQLQSVFGVRLIESPFYYTKSENLKRILRLYFDEYSKVDDFIVELLDDISVEYAEKISIDKIDYIPTDYNANVQYHLAKINATRAWDITKGNSNIIVAVVDNAIQTTHDELVTNLVNGWDVADQDNDPNPPHNLFSHGTHVAGIASAVTDNVLSTGSIASIGFNIKIMPIKAQYSLGLYNTVSKGYEGVVWAAHNGADIINMSWGSNGGFDQAKQDIINDVAVTYGCILVAAAGNNSTSSLHYPAAYTNVVSVANTDEYDAKVGSSNYGNWIDISAPGNNIFHL
jgi:subtilisin family serine protease